MLSKLVCDISNIDRNTIGIMKNHKYIFFDKTLLKELQQRSIRKIFFVYLLLKSAINKIKWNKNTLLIKLQKQNLR